MTTRGAATMAVSDVRRQNLSIVLEHLVNEGPRSRAWLAEATGLTKGTVSLLVADLLERDLVEELDTPRAGGRGRPATNVAAGGRVGGLGLEIDVDHVAASVVDVAGERRAYRRLATDNRRLGSARVIDRLRRASTDVLAEAAALDIRCVGATLAVPGLVDPASGHLLVAPNLHGFDADLATATRRLGLPPDVPVRVDNEANLAALAELRRGAGRQVSSFVYVSGGIGIGAGIVLDGHLWRGAHGFAGEFGHVIVDPLGRACACGARGCLETVAGSTSRAPWPEVAEALATALRSVVHVLDPEAVILGGGFSALGDAFATAVRDRLLATTLNPRWSPCEVWPSDLGADAAMIGAGQASLDRVIADPTLVAPQVAARSA